MDVLNRMVEEIQGVVKEVDTVQLVKTASVFDLSKRVFVDGEGRSGLMMKALAIRLMHLGYTVFVVGETINPAIREGDIFLVASGSGKSKALLAHVEKAKDKKAYILSVTSNKDTSLSKVSDINLIIPGSTKFDIGENRKSIQLLSSLFDQTLHIVIDALCLMLSERDNVKNDDAKKAHW
ncbi:MAG: 6-phospho-3-hexuloisomerase [Breznakia sp.]